MLKDEDSKKIEEVDEDIRLEPAEEEVGEENLREKIRELKEKVKKYSEEKTEYLSGWQRAKADYVNLKKEEEFSRGESQKRVTEKIISEILPVLDGFEMAIGDNDGWNKAPENWRKGIEHIYKDLKNTLSRYGLSEICPKKEDDVNFHHHNVVLAEETENPEKDGKIMELLQKGYELSGKVLRPASVKAFVFKK